MALDFFIVEAAKWIAGFSFAFPRLFAAFAVLPFFTRESIGVVRGGFMVSVLILVIPLVSEQRRASDVTFTEFLFLLPKEVFIGLLIGFIISMPFHIGSAAGKIIDMQRGDSISSTFDPMLKAEESSLGRLINQGQFVLFFASGSFLLALQAIYESYLVWPVPQFLPQLNVATTESIGNMFQTMFYMSVVMASPIVILMLIVDVTMGFIGRFVTNLQVFIVAFPIKGLLAAFVLATYIVIIMRVLDDQLMQSGFLLDVLRGILENGAS